MVVQRDGFPVGYIKEDSQSGYRVLGLILGEVFLTVGFWVFPEGFGGFVGVFLVGFGGSKFVLKYK